MDAFTRCVHNEQMSEFMSLALDGLLSADELHRLQDHLAACPLCQAEWQAMQQVSALFARSPQVGPPLGFALRVDRRLEEKLRKRRRTFGGVAMLTGSLSLAGVTVAAVVLIVLGVLAWRWLGTQPAVQQGTHAVSQVASGVGLVGRGASFFLRDLLLRCAAPLLLVLGAGLAVLLAGWVLLFLKRPHNHPPAGL